MYSTLSYNENGSVVSYEKSGNRFDISYNPLERISEVSINGNLVSKYTYDPIGERVKKEIYSNGNLEKTVIYFYGQEGLLAEYDENMNLIKKYIWNPDRPWSTDPLYQEDSSGNKYFYINDHLFTPQKLVDENFNVVWQGDYFSFGNVNETVNQIENNLRFPGQYYDSETGFYYNFHRYYAPEIGRYLREDPVRNGLNYYLYVSDNPVEGVDYLGLTDKCCKEGKTCCWIVCDWAKGPISNIGSEIISDFNMRKFHRLYHCWLEWGEYNPWEAGSGEESNTAWGMHPIGPLEDVVDYNHGDRKGLIAFKLSKGCCEQIQSNPPKPTRYYNPYLVKGTCITAVLDYLCSLDRCKGEAEKFYQKFNYYLFWWRGSCNRR